MERQLWNAIVMLLSQVDKRQRSPKERYSDAVIVKVWLWAVLHDRGRNWACRSGNWPVYERRWQKPSESQLSRRLRSASVCGLLEQLEAQVLAPKGHCLVWAIDGKPLMISGCSKDRQAGYGRAAGCKAKGYKLHVLVNSQGSVAAWRTAPMNKDERIMAERMLRTAAVQGYVLADSNYDSNKLHDICGRRGNLQLVTPRRYGSRHGHGHRRQTPGRMRSKALLENPRPEFGRQLFAERIFVERYFASLTSYGGGLTHLPPWVRTHRRVRQWVQAKMILHALKQRIKTTTYEPSCN